jgi:hypothetical protein
MNIARGRRFSMIGRSAPSSCGFSAAREPELEGRGVYGISRLRVGIAADAPYGR